jgi:hypothetical protein
VHGVAPVATTSQVSADRRSGKVLTFMSKGFANMVVQMAFFDTTVLGSSGQSVQKPALSVRTDAGQRGSAR